MRLLCDLMVSLEVLLMTIGCRMRSGESGRSYRILMCVKLLVVFIIP